MSSRSAAVLIPIGAAIFGYAMASLPASDDPSAFWIGNFSSPWAVLAFGAGWSQRRPARAVLVAVLAELACVVGFYERGFTLDPMVLGLPRDTAPVMVAVVCLGKFLSFAAPWLIAGVGAGVVYGFLGAWWGRSRALLPAILLALPFFVEPLAWRLYDGQLKGPAWIWVCEALAGMGLLVAMTVASRRQPLPGTS